MQFSHKSELEKHIDVVHCDSEHITKEKSDPHIELEEKSTETDELKPLSCTLCKKAFVRKHALTRHVDAVHHKLKPFSCTLCVKSFTTKQSLTKHVEAVHYKLKPFSCTLCDKSFAQKCYLTTHVDAVHHKLKSFSCALCDKSFATKRNLTLHVDSVHNKLKPFSCTLCDKSFSLKKHLTGHVNVVHHKLKPFSCTLCNKSFRDKPYLKQHVDAVHNKLKPFSCTLCDKSFSKKVSLTKHVNSVHRNDKLNDGDIRNPPKHDNNAETNDLDYLLAEPYSCGMCEKSLMFAENLTKHMQIHGIKEPFSFSLPETQLNTKHNVHDTFASFDQEIKLDDSDRIYAEPPLVHGYPPPSQTVSQEMLALSEEVSQLSSQLQREKESVSVLHYQRGDIADTGEIGEESVSAQFLHVLLDDNLCNEIFA